MAIDWPNVATPWQRLLAKGGLVGARVRAFPVWDFARAAAAALGLKVAGSALAILMISVATRNMPPAEFGIVARWFSTASFLVIVAVAGQELLIVRSWGEYTEARRGDLAKGALVFGATMITGGAILVAAAMYVAGTWLGTPHALILAVCSFAVTQTMLLFTSHAGRAIVGLFCGDGLRELGFRSVTIVGLLALVATRQRPDAVDFFVFAAAGTALVVAIQVFWMARTVPRDFRTTPSAVLRREWSARAFKMWIASLVESTNQYWDVIIVGWMLSPAAGGAYFVATRVANIFSIATGAFHVLSTKNIATHFHAGQLSALRQRFRVMAFANIALVGGGLGTIAIAGYWLLSIFGPTYANEHGLVVVLSVAAAINTAGGPAPALLLLTGHESAYVNVIAAGALLRCVLLVSLVGAFGLTGAAFAAAGTSIAVTVMLVFVCRHRLKIDPSVFGLVSNPARTTS